MTSRYMAVAAALACFCNSAHAQKVPKGLMRCNRFSAPTLMLARGMSQASR